MMHGIFSRGLSHLALAGLFIFSASQTLPASENTAVLSKVQSLMQQKDYYAAKLLLAGELKANKNSWQLWMALGDVFEAANEYKQAVAAFKRASEIKTGIEGLAARITRLQELADKTPSRPEPELQPENKALQMLQQAHKLDEQGKTLEAGRLFVEAVELDRSLLARDTSLIDKALRAFKSTSTEPENLFYLGAFYFYAGQYSAAEATLNSFVGKYHESDKIALARKLLEECREIIAQVLAANAAAAEKEAAAATERLQKAKAERMLATATQVVTAAAPETTPEFTNEYEFQNQSSDEHPALVYARNKAAALLEEYSRETDEDRKLGIIWNLGKLRMPTPETMTGFAGFLESGNVDTIFAALEALEKINQPGAQACMAQLYKLLGNEDQRIVYRAIKTFSRMPMAADQIVPRIFRIYQGEKVQIRRQTIVNTVKAYGQESITILDTMLKQAEMANKRPIAELLSAVTGEDVETLINNS